MPLVPCRRNMAPTTTLTLVLLLGPAIFTADDDLWRYHLTLEDDLVYKDYYLAEMQPHTALLCPGDYFIYKLSYHFPLPENLKMNPEEREQFIHTYGIGDNTVELHVQNASELWRHLLAEDSIRSQNGGDVVIDYDSDEQRQKTDAHEKHGPCPNLIYCVGVQACLFRFSIELCRHDPIPSYRKYLSLRLTCAKQSLWPTIVSDFRLHDAATSWLQQTVYLNYKSSVEKGRLDMYRHTDVIRVRRRSRDVFQTFCPDVHTARTLGYAGNCSGDPASRPEQTESVWRNIGRTLTQGCANELVEVYCSFQYNSSGHCAPPFLLHKQSGKEFNTVTRPQTGEWPDATAYRKILTHPHRSLIPVRLGFAVLAHAAADVVIDLLQMIYRPQHFYVVHIDHRADATREELQNLIRKYFRDVSNIRVIPKERSVKASWGGFGITRAELESMEELMRMGLWDFSMVLSGSDVPLRNVDDLAASLAPYRGNSFLNINHRVDPNNEHLTTAWHTCDDHVFRIGPRTVPPEIDVYSHSAFVLLSREAVELVLSTDPPSVVDDLHYYLSSMFVADESYIGTILLASHLKNTPISRMFHFTRHFEPHNIINLCRHSDVTDSCGQGPGDFTPEDLNPIRAHAHHFFFARKFKTDLRDPVRAEIAENYRHNAYQSAVSAYVPAKLLEKLARFTLTHFPAAHQVAAVGRIKFWHILTNFRHSDPCCRVVAERRSMLADEFRLLMEYSVVDKSGQEHDATATFIPAPLFRCYPGGSIRLMHVTTRRHPLEPGFKPIHLNLPTPTVPAGGTTLWIQLHLDLTPVPTSCSDLQHKNNPNKEAYLMFPPEEEVRRRPFHIMADIIVTDVTGIIRCGEEIRIQLGPEQLEPHGPALWFQHPIKCPNITPGVWKVTLREKHQLRPFVYSVKVAVLSERPPSLYETQVLNQAHALWRVDDVMINDDDVERFYRTPTPAQSFPEVVPEEAAGKDSEKSSKTDEETLVRDPEGEPEEKSTKSQFERNLGFVLEFYDCLILAVLLAVATGAIYCMCSSMLFRGRKRPRVNRTRCGGAALVACVVIMQVVLYAQLDTRTVLPAL